MLQHHERNSLRQAVSVRTTHCGRLGYQRVPEQHIFDFDRDLYGSSIRLGFVQRLRDERAFESLEALHNQIAADCGRARVLFDHLSL